MAKTLALRSALTAQLKTSCGMVFFDHAEFPKQKRYPYCVYTLEELSCEDGKTLCELEVNVVDYGKDTERCERMCDDIQKRMDHLLHMGEEVEFSAYKERRQPVSEEDRNIIRRRLTFELHVYERRSQ